MDTYLKRQNVMGPKGTLHRLTRYYEYLKAQHKEGVSVISSTKIAEEMHLNPVLVRKDIALASSVSGKPRVGFPVNSLIKDIEKFLGYNNVNNTILIGVGSLGRALLSYEGFQGYGLNIACAFDINPTLHNNKINNITILPMEKLESEIARNNVKMGIITVPKQSAQSICDRLIKAGIKGIWNFAPTHLIVPKKILLKDENLAASLALLSRQLTTKHK